MAKLPVTKARSSLSIKLYFVPSIPTNILTFTPSQIKSFKPQTISGVEKFTEHESRHSTPRYEVDADIAGNVVGRVRTITEKKITIDRTVMYANDINSVLDVGIELIDQNVPFAILKVETAPEGTGIPNKVTMFLGCYIHSIPKNFELGRDLKVVQSIDIGYKEKVFLDSSTLL